MNKVDLSQLNFSFPVKVYGNLEKYNDVLSKGRCRIFYKYANRNGTYITDEFAEELVSTLPYTPVKGIFDEEKEDYTDHGKARNLGRIYGIVPESLNFAWEKHEDEDGEERIYACCDVLVFTALYDEAKDIIDKPQSMELYAPSIKGDWKIIEGKKNFVFEKGCFLGLQILGDDVTPCFEGAAFYSCYNSVYELLEKIKAYELKTDDKGGETKMAFINYKISDSQKFQAIWSLLNTEYNEENGWVVTYDICDIYDAYAIVRNYNEQKFERVYYSKNDENDSLEITSREDCYIVDVNAEEKAHLDSAYQNNGNTYAEMGEKIGQYDELKQSNENYELKIVEKDQEISTLTTEKEKVESDYSAAQATIESLNTQVTELQSFKDNAVKTAKQSIISKYAKKLDEKVIEKFNENIDEYSLDSLEKELAFSLVNSDTSIFGDSSSQSGIVPTNLELTGIDAILAKYNK